MKRLIRIFLILVMVVAILAACRSADGQQMNSQPLQTDPSTTAPQIQPTFTTTAVQETTVPTEPTVSSAPLECTVKRIATALNYVPDGVKWPIVINSTAQLCTLLQEWQPYLGVFREPLLNSLSEFYNDEFFKESTLVLICFYAKPGYATCVVEECLKMEDGTYSITVAEPERTFGGAFSNYLFMGLHVPDDVPLDAVINILFDDTENMILMKSQ